MIKNRFFHSSIQEIHLHVKEIYSLQDGLREKILNSPNKSTKKIIAQKKDSQELVKMLPVNISSEPRSTTVSSSPTNDVFETSSSENGLSNDELIKSRDTRNQIQQPQADNIAQRNHLGLNSALNDRKIVTDISKESSENSNKAYLKLVFFLLFLILGITILGVIFYFLQFTR